MADDKNTKKLFIFPDAAERQKRLGEQLPKFLSQYSEDELPKKFKKGARRLVEITTDPEAFMEYIAQHQRHRSVLQACEFISEKTGSEYEYKETARLLQDEWINGLMQIWGDTVGKYIGEDEPKEFAIESAEGKVVLEIMQTLLSVNIKRLISAGKSKDTQLNDIPTEDMMGDAYQLLVRCVFAYQKPLEGGPTAHFKTYFTEAFKRGFFSKYRQQNKEQKDVLFTDMSAAGEDPLRFEDRHADTRELSPGDQVLLNQTTSAVRVLIERLVTPPNPHAKNPPDYKEIMQAHIARGSSDEATYEFIKMRYGVSKDKSKQYLNGALRALRRAAAEDMRLKDIASDKAPD